MGSEQWSVVSGQWSVVSGRWSVVGGQWSVVSGRWSVVGGQWTVVSGQWSVVSGQWSVVGGRWSVVSGRWSVVSGQWSVGSGQEVCVTVKSYQELQVWQKAMIFVESIYRATQTFPREEQFGLTSQLRRAAVSIPSNIAEGQGRHSTQAFQNHLSIAYGSLQEVETQTILAYRLGFMTHAVQEELLGAAGEIARMLNGLQRSLTMRKSDY